MSQRALAAAKRQQKKRAKQVRISLDDKLVRVTKAGKLFPDSIPEPSVTSIWRYVNKGKNGFRLATILINGYRYTTQAAVDEFLAHQVKEGAA